MPKPIKSLISATCVDFDLNDSQVPSAGHKFDQVDFWPGASDSANANGLQGQNGSAHRFISYRRGKLLNNCGNTNWNSLVNGIYIFMVSCDNDATPLVGTGKYVAPPCPPFCDPAGEMDK